MGLGLTFDTGALIALERRKQRMVDVFRRAAQRGVRITVPATVVAEWWRGQGRAAAELLACMDVEPLDETLSKVAGEAIAQTRGASVVDAIVVASAARRGDFIYTSDVGDLTKLAVHFPSLRVFGV